MIIMEKYHRVIFPVITIIVGLFPFGLIIKNKKWALVLQKSLFIVLGLLYLLMLYIYGI